jgi:hypothetical protein
VSRSETGGGGAGWGEWKKVRQRIDEGVVGVGASGIFDVIAWTREWERGLFMATEAVFVDSLRTIPPPQKRDTPPSTSTSSSAASTRVSSLSSGLSIDIGHLIVSGR